MTIVTFTASDGSPLTGGLPSHVHDDASGVFTVFAAFDDLDPSGSATGTAKIYVARLDAQGAQLAWADGTLQKTVVTGTPSAGRAVVLIDLYDPERPIILRHGDRTFASTLGGEVWTERV